MMTRMMTHEPFVEFTQEFTFFQSFRIRRSFSQINKEIISFLRWNNYYPIHFGLAMTVIIIGTLSYGSETSVISE